MAVVLGMPRKMAKGVVVFTHNEAVIVERNGTHLVRDRLSFDERNELRIARKRMRKLKDRYLFGCHFNFRNKTLVLPKSAGLFDFYLSTRKTYSMFLPEAKRINTVASFFVEDNYLENFERDIDILYVATDSKVKNWGRFLSVCEQLLLERPGLRVMAVQTGRHDFSSNQTQVNALRLKFPTAALDFRYVRLSGPGKGLPGHEIKTFMNRAKVFTHFSEKEGQATVISEAFMAGCKVGLYSALHKMSVELPGTSTWRLYSRGNEAKVILELLDSVNPNSSDMSEVREFFGEKANIRFLSSSIQTIVAPVIPNFHDLDNLKHRLPAHTAQGKTWDKNVQCRNSAALQSISDLKSLLNFLEEN